MCAQSLQSRPTLCDPMECNLPGSSVHGILQARTLEWVAISSSRDLPDLGIEPMSFISYLLQFIFDHFKVEKFHKSKITPAVFQ